MKPKALIAFMAIASAFISSAAPVWEWPSATPEIIKAYEELKFRMESLEDN